MTATSKKEVFDELFAINVNGHTEKKKSGSTELTYLSWPFAWAEVKRRYPSAKYSINRTENGLPYVFDEKTGYMVSTTVEIEGIEHQMWLPVMDSNNRAMKDKPYAITFKSGKSITVEAATMMDINKSLMRCLVKNLAMFGVGLYIYAGEDIPQPEQEERMAQAKEKEEDSRKEQIKAVIETISKEGISADDIKKLYKVKELAELKLTQCDHILKNMEKIKTMTKEKKDE